MENIFEDNGHGERYPDIEAMIEALKASGAIRLDWQQMDYDFAEATHPTDEHAFYQVRVAEEDEGFTFGTKLMQLTPKSNPAEGSDALELDSDGGFALFADAVSWCEQNAPRATPPVAILTHADGTEEHIPFTDPRALVVI